MGVETKIEWTHWPDTRPATWNPTKGCSRISAGCGVGKDGGCYAERFAMRFSGEGHRYHGFVRSTPEGPRWTGKLAIDEDALLLPLRWKSPRTIFCASMTDVFHEKLRDEDIDRIFAVMALATRHRFLVLTKRAARMRAYLSDPKKHERWSPLISKLSDRFRRHTGGVAATWWPNFSKHIFIGTSVEDQPSADSRIWDLLETPAFAHFISLEPQLANVDLAPWLGKGLKPGVGVKWRQFVDDASYRQNFRRDPPKNSLDWVVQGGESGPSPRPYDIAWPRFTRDQCAATNTAWFHKQMGAFVVSNGVVRPGEAWGCEHRKEEVDVGGDGLKFRHHLKNRKGGDMSEWPEDLRVRQLPKVRA